MISMMVRQRSPLLVGLLASLAVLVSQAAGKGFAGTAPIRPKLYLAPGGSDSGRCTKKAPCRSFARAFAVASGGASISVAAGDYTSSCNPIRGAKSNFVTFVGVRGARVICPLRFDGAHRIEMRRITLYQIITENSSFLRFKDLAVTCTDSAPYELI